MRKPRILLAGLIGGLLAAGGGAVPPAQAQGTINFNNRVIADGIDAPVFDSDGVTRLSGAAFLAQLWVGHDPEPLSPIGQPVVFRTGNLAGYVARATVVASVPAGDMVYVQMRAWDAAAGDSYDAALRAGGKTGHSNTIQVKTGNYGDPPALPANLVGLASFQLQQQPGIPVITRQPAGGVVYETERFIFPVVATGQSPFSYQWRRNGVPIPNATNDNYTLESALPGDSGGYSVVIANALGTATSSEAALTVLPLPAGAAVSFGNRAPGAGLDAPVYDVDGQTRLAGAAYVAQLYGGPTADSLAPVGGPVPFFDGALAGYWDAGTEPWREIPGVAPGSEAFIQVRAWEKAKGATYEEAVAAGGKAGYSEVLRVTTGGRGAAQPLPAVLAGLQSFKLASIPIILLPPQEQAVVEGDIVAFTVEALSYLPVAYQWRFNGADIPQATNQMLRIFYARTSNAGEYSVVVGNALGSVVSAPARLRVEVPTGGGLVNFNNRVPAADIDAPVFDVDGTTRLEGAAFVAMLYAGPTEDTLGAVGAPVSFRTGQTAGYLDPRPNALRVLPNVAPGGAAWLQVRVWEAAYGSYEQAVAAGGKYGSSKVISVETGGGGEPPELPADMKGLESFHLVQAPVITRQPVGGVFYAGQPVTLQIEVASATPVSYQWHRNGAPVPGATAAMLGFPEVQSSDSGAYQVLVSNAAGSTWSRIASIGVSVIPAGATVHFGNLVPQAGLDAPVFDLDGTTRLAGSAYVAQLFAGADRDNLSAVGDPVPFLDGENAGYWEMSTNSWRAIPGLTPGATAFVQVRVWEHTKGKTYEEALAAGGKVGLSEVLEVVTGGPGAVSPVPTVLTGLKSFKVRRIPLIVRQPQDTEVLTGSSATFTVVISSVPPVAFQWRFNGTDIPGATNGSFKILNVKRPDAGAYSVVVANELGSVVSAPANLIVHLALGYGGVINFCNRAPGVNAPVFDVDGVTPLLGNAFVAELWVGPTRDDLTVVGIPWTFWTGTNAGYFFGPKVVLPNLDPGASAYVQVKAWEAAAGTNFAAAVQAGAKFGSSPVFAMTTGDGAAQQGYMIGLQSFHLEQVPLIQQVPFGGTVYAGQEVALSVSASSATTVGYQWVFNEIPLEGATNAWLEFPSALVQHTGAYAVIVTNPTGSVVTSNVVLTVLPVPALAAIHFSNHAPRLGVDAPVLDSDCVTRLAGDNFLAELCVGVEPGALAPICPPVPFLTGTEAGYWDPGPAPWREVPGVSPGTRVFAQVRVWERAKGATFEEANAGGGKTGASDVLELVAGGPGASPAFPSPLSGLRGFFLTGPPVITGQPMSLGVWIASPVSFVVVVANPASALYQWLFNGAEIPQATNAVYNISEVGLGHAGSYSVRVSNAISSVVSSNAALRVYIASGGGGTIYFNNRVMADGVNAPVRDVDGTLLSGPAFAAQLMVGATPDSLVAVGQPVPFKTGSLAGYFNGGTVTSPIGAAGAVVFVQYRVWELAAYPTYEAAVAAGGKFGCSAIVTVKTGGYGDPPSLAATVPLQEGFTLQQVPVITGQPAGGTVFVGDTLTLSVSVRSAAPVTYQWQRDGIVLGGATNAAWVLADLGLESAGTYRVVVANPTGSVTSSSAVVAVQELPAGALVKFANRVPKAGLDAPVFDVDGVTRLAGAAFVAQLHAGPSAESLLPVGTPAPFLTGADAGYWDAAVASWRVIPGVSPGATAFAQVWVWEMVKGATYQEALAAGGKVGCSEIMEVTTGGAGTPPGPPVDLTALRTFQLGTIPVIIAQPERKLVRLGWEVTFQVEVTGTAPLTFQWQFKGSDLPAATNSSLNIPSAQLADTGSYRVRIGNALGSVVSSEAALTVVPPNLGGGTVNFSNYVPEAGVNAPVFATDGQTKLQGATYSVQLWAGLTDQDLAPASPAVSFSVGALAGYFNPSGPSVQTLNNVPPGADARVQVRVWESVFGATFDQALANGGKTGLSKMLVVVAGGEGLPAANLVGLESFKLRPPLPLIAVQPVDRWVNEGGSVTFVVSVTNTAPVAYQWQRQVAANEWLDLAGADSPVLVLAQAGPEAAGYYRVAVSNATGPVTSEVAQLWFSPIVRLGDWSPQFNLTLSAGYGPDYLIEVSTNLTQWQTLTNVTTTSQSLELPDDQASEFRARFYRARSVRTGTVASESAVGFVDVWLTPGFSMVANQLLTATNTIDRVFAGVPDGTMFYKYDPASGTYVIVSLMIDQWDFPGVPLEPGEGVLALNSSEDTYRIRLKGAVPQGALSISLTKGWAMYSSPVPQAGRLDTLLGFPVSYLDMICRYDPFEETFVFYVYSGGWVGEAPVVELGEAFWAWKWNAGVWQRAFSVGD
jgi:hypothetical protein